MNRTTISLGLVRVTEAAALSCVKWYGRANPLEATNAACNSMKIRLDLLDLKGKIIAGVDTRRIDQTEFTKPLMTGQSVGWDKCREVDVALNPLECAFNLSKGKLNSVSVVCTSPPGGMMKVPNVYMDKLAVGPALKGKVSLDQPIEEMLSRVAEVMGKEIEEVVVCILDRERNMPLIEKIRKFGPQIRLFSDGDLAGGMGTHPWSNEDIDIALGTGKSYQGLMAAVGLKCVGGDFQGKFLIFNDDDKQEIDAFGIDKDKIYTMNDLAPASDLNFAATGISNSPFLKGIRFYRQYAKTRSILARSSSGTVRYIDTYHKL